MNVAAMRSSCDEAETQLALTNESSKLLLERAGSLRDERFIFYVGSLFRAD